MRRNKPGLADLKALRKQTEAPEAESPPAAAAKRVARKRSPFLPPSGTAGAAAEGAAGKAAPRPSVPATPDLESGADAGRDASPDANPSGALLSEADRRLFRSAVRYVDRIKDPGRLLLAPVPKAPAELLKERRMRAAGLEESRSSKRAAGAAKNRGAEAAASNADRDKPAPKTPPLSDTYTSANSEQDDRQYLKAGHGPDILKDLKRGKWAIGASLDLHGSTVDDARERFERFVASCLAHDVKCVRIVHGKGYGSRNGDAVLKTTVRRWLTQLAEVIAYTECAPADGGSGAVQVLLQ